MNCSCTHVNRSSRAKPAFTLRCSGATCTGFMFWMNIAVDRRPALEVVADRRSAPAPMRDMSSTRTLGSSDVEPFDQRLVPVVDGAVVVEARRRPRAATRPSRDGMHSAACMLCGAVALAREAVAEPEVGLAAWCRPSARRSRSRRRVSPVMALAHSGVLSRRCASSSRGQSVYCSRYGQLAWPSRNSTCITAQASAPSVPGRRHSAMSACCMVPFW